jgi:hypothetical protein
MRFNHLLGLPSEQHRARRARQFSGRSLVYETLENRRLLAGVSAAKAGSLLTISIDGDTEAAYVSKLATGNIKVAKDAAGTPATGTPAAGYSGIERIEVEDVNDDENDAQSVTFQDNLDLPDGLEIDGYVETTNLNGDITGTTHDNSITIYSGMINLNADVLTAGGDVDFGGGGFFDSVVVAKSDVTIATGEDGALVAGDVALESVNGPGGLTVDATADSGNDGDVAFRDVGANAPLAHLRVSTGGEIEWQGRRISTNGEVILSAGFLSSFRRFLRIDSQSLPNEDGGDIELEFTGVDDWIRVLQLNTSGGAGKLAGSATLPLGFERMATNGDSAIFQEPTTHSRIVVNESALTSPSTTLFSHDFTANAVSAAIKPQSATNGNVAGNRYQIAPSTTDGDAVAIISPLTLPAKFALSATVNMSGTSSGAAWSNGLLIFDFVDTNNYKYAGAADGANEYVLGEVVGGMAQKLQSVSAAIASNTDISLRIEIRGAEIKLFAGGSQKLTHTFGSNLTGKIGVGAMRAKTTFDDLLVTSIT